MTFFTQNSFYTLFGILSAKLVIECSPPYVIGVSGSWGSGKTSVLRKLWFCLNGEITKDIQYEEKVGLSCPPKKKGKNICEDCRFEKIASEGCHFEELKNIEPLWFSPWQHQFEASPAVALLQQIRTHFAGYQKVYQEGKKVTHVAAISALNVLGGLTKLVSMGTVDFKNIGDSVEKRGKQYEEENFENKLMSSHFLECYQESVKTLLAGRDKNKLVVFIDDLDRCFPHVALRMIEAFKLYLGVNNCVYILAMDRGIIEKAIDREIFKSDGIEINTMAKLDARDYLDKIVQTTYPVPTPVTINGLVTELIKHEPPEIIAYAHKWFDLILPHNPRKIKTFITTFRNYLQIVIQNKTTPVLDLVAILSYLCCFEEEIYQAVEENPYFFKEVVYFGKGKTPSDDDYRFLHLKQPPSEESDSYLVKSDKREFRISELIKKQSEFLESVDISIIKSHLFNFKPEEASSI